VRAYNFGLVGVTPGSFTRRRAAVPRGKRDNVHTTFGSWDASTKFGRAKT